MKLPTVHPRKFNKAIAKCGWFDDHQKGGEHIKYKEGHPNPISVPYHGSEDLKPGTMRELLRAAGISREQFLELLGKKRKISE